MRISEKERRATIVVDDHNGILPYTEAFYIYSIIYSASICLDAFGRYDALPKTQDNTDELICVVQEAVGHSAALSRYFWPSPQGNKKQPLLRHLKEKRGEKLRKAFEIDEGSPLNNRDLRNAWEHFDERLDEHLLETDSGVFFPLCILDSHDLADDPLGHIFKLLDVQEECIVLMGEKYYFEPIRSEVYRIRSVAVDFSLKGGRLKIKNNA